MVGEPIKSRTHARIQKKEEQVCSKQGSTRVHQLFSMEDIIYHMYIY